MARSLSEWISRYRFILLVLVAVGLAYANHFHNSFHFDDAHTIVDNPSIRSLRNIPALFSDTSTFSVLPANRAWRPLVPVSLAIDYALGKGLQPVAFHVSTFLWFLVLVSIVYRLALHLFEAPLLAAFAAGWYGLHPVCAETVNYVIQRGDLYAALGATAGLFLYTRSRKYGLYLLPVIAGQLSKPPALIFPVLLLAYLFIIERRKLKEALRAVIPSVVVTVGIAVLTARMTPPSFNAGAVSAFAYRITQPYVALRYFISFFLPVNLSADTELSPIMDLSDVRVLLGVAFLGSLIAAAVYCSRRADMRVIGFGIVWFLATLAPTSLFPLAEVENDHRMFFPFIGLTLSVVWGLHLALRPILKPAIAVAAGIAILGGFWIGTHMRNKVWLDEGTLWRDVTLKSPTNGRGLMNYGLTLMSAGDYGGALDHFNRAELYTPNYSVLEINLGIIHGQVGHMQDAEHHFLRAIQLTPNESLPYHYYGRWLEQSGRHTEALGNIRRAIAINPAFLASHDVLRQIERGMITNPVDLARYEQDARTPDQYLDLSLRYHQAKRYPDSIRMAQSALRIKSDFPEAYNNLAAAYEELGQWDKAIEAANRALQLRPDFVLARNNLAWSMAQKGRSQGRNAR